MIRRLDRLVVQELIGPWLFGVGMFTVLIVAITFLTKASEFLVNGANGLDVIKLIALNIPAIAVKTFAMSMLLASLLAFGRLSGDSEIVAIRASGVSIFRIMQPVVLFALAVAVLAFATNETVVPGASMQTLRLQSDIEKRLRGTLNRVSGYPIEENGKLKALLTARDISLETRTMREAGILVYDENGRITSVLRATAMEFDPKLIGKGQGWRIVGGGNLTSIDGSVAVQLEDGAWPAEVPQLTATPEQILTDKVNNLDVFSMGQIRHEIGKEKERPNPRREKIANYEFGYWNKIGLPLAALVFGILGAPLGIRNHRTGTAVGFALAIAIIFAYFMLTNMLNTIAMGGGIPPYVASFAPIVVGVVAACFIIWRKNA